MVRPEVVDAFRAQIGGCRKAGSELTARLMERCVAELEAGGPLARLLADWRGEPVLDALPQRVVGAVQGLALDGARIGRAELLRTELYQRMRRFLEKYEFLLGPVN